MFAEAERLPKDYVLKPVARDDLADIRPYLLVNAIQAADSYGGIFRTNLILRMTAKLQPA
jgi:hypothetical protein